MEKTREDKYKAQKRYFAKKESENKLETLYQRLERVYYYLSVDFSLKPEREEKLLAKAHELEIMIAILEQVEEVESQWQ